MGHKPDTVRTPEEQLAHIRAVNARNAQKWRKKNPLKVARNCLRYWQRKVDELEAAEAGNQTPGE